MTQQSPVLSVVTEGPKSIIVGKEETYKFVVTNNSSVPAEAVVVNIELPRWAESTQTPELSTGSNSLLPQQQNDEYGIFQWQVGPIAPNKSETLKLHIVLRERRPFELKCSYDFKQRASQAKIEVQQPVIKMEFEGPDEVIWGSEESYRLRIKNTGNGDATDLGLKLSTSGVVKAETVIESLKVGEERTLDVIVEALEPDMAELQIKVEANGLYGLSDETTKSVIIKRASLELDIDAPGKQFVDNTIDYVLIARNMGTTTSLNTAIEATLPLGVEYRSCSHDGEFDSDTNRVRWEIGTLSIGSEFVCTVVCEAKREGECRFEAKVSEKTGLIQTANASTYMEAIADIVLEIEKPQDPIEVGTMTDYVVVISNRGSKAAENIEVGVYFSDAIEPVSVEGGKANVNAERREVVFERIPVLSARDKLTYKIKGRGLDSGSHRIKAILVCQSTETELDTEVKSRFYQGRNSKLSSNTPAGETQNPRGNSTSLVQGNPLRDDKTTYPSPSTVSGMPTGIPSATRPGTTTRDSLAMAPKPANSSAKTGLPSSQMQDAGNGVPVMQIPEMALGQPSVVAPTPPLGASPGRVRTNSAPTLSPPPVIDVN